jgi:hypothetical protein
VQQRHAEREGLAHAGAGLTDEVVTGQGERQGQLLDGEGVFDALFGERADDLVPDAELGKADLGMVVKGVMLVASNLPVSFLVRLRRAHEFRLSPKGVRSNWAAQTRARTFP